MERIHPFMAPALIFDIDILLVARCLVPWARLLYLCHEACNKRSQATGPRKGKGKQRKHTNVGVDIQSYMHHKLPNNVREIADRRFVAWSAVNFRPQNMMHDIGFKFFLGVWDPDYTSRTMSAERYDEILLNLYGEVRETLLAEIHEHRDSCLALGYKGPFLSGQVDLTTVAGAEYITFSASYIPPGEATIKRIELATRAFTGSHTANDVQYWLKKVRNASGRE